MGYDAPFAGLKVLDLSQGIAGPYCGMLLTQQGAALIKVEPVDSGDSTRPLVVTHSGQTAPLLRSAYVREPRGTRVR